MTIPLSSSATFNALVDRVEAVEDVVANPVTINNIDESVVTNNVTVTGGNEAALSAYASLSAAVTALGSTVRTRLLINEDQNVSTATTVTANIILVPAGGKLTKTSSGSITFQGPGLADPESQQAIFYGFAAGDITYTGSVHPKRVSTELVDTGNTSLTARVTRTDAALAGKPAQIIASPRQLTDSATITENHHLVFSEGDYPSVVDTWGTTYYSAFHLQSNTRVTGNNLAIIHESPHSGSTRIFLAYHMRYGGGETTLTCENIIIEGLNLVGDPAHVDIAGGYSPVHLGNCHHGLISNCRFDGLHGYTTVIGGEGSTGNFAYDSHVLDCTFIGMGSQICDIINGKNCSIQRCTFDQTDSNNTNSYVIIDCEPNVDTDVLENIKIAECLFDLTNEIQDGTKYGTAIAIQGTMSGSIKHLTIAENRILGATIWPEPTDYSALGSGVFVNGATELDIHENYIRTAVLYGMQFKQCRYGNLSNNTMIQCRDVTGHDAPLQFYSCAGLVIENNKCLKSASSFGQSAGIYESETEYAVTTSGATITAIRAVINLLFYDFFPGLTATINATDYEIDSFTYQDTIAATTSIGTLAQKTFTSANVNTTTNAIAIASHGHNTGSRFRLTTTGALPSPLAVDTTYFAINDGSGSIKPASTLANALAGTPVDLTTGGSGTHTLTPVMRTKFSSNKYINNDAEFILLEPTGTSEIVSSARDGIAIPVSDADYTVLPGEMRGIISYTALSSARTVTLPDATYLRGKRFIIKDAVFNAGAFNITVDGYGSQTIDGDPSQAITTDGGSLEVQSNGANWIVLNKPNPATTPLAPRVTTITSSATPTPDASTTDVYEVTTLATNATFGAPTGSAVHKQKLELWVRDNGTTRTLAYNNSYRAMGVTLPTATVADAWQRIECEYNANDSAWDAIAVNVGDPIFTPGSVSGLWMWLKADGIMGLSDGDPVTTWEDMGSGDHDATQSTGGAKPTYKTGIVNGKPVVRFDGTSDFLTLEDQTALTEGEMFIVWKITGNGGGNFMSGSGGGTAYYPYTNGLIYENFGTTSRKDAITPGVTLTNFHIYNVWTKTSDYAMNHNGSSIYTSATNTVLFSQTAPRLCENGTGSEFVHADVAEVIIYNRKLTTPERGDVNTYLTDKYAIV